MANMCLVPLPVQIEWYKIRDTFFGHNCVSQNIPLALEMAVGCKHPDARWLTEACAGKDVTTKEDAKRVFSALGQNDARALCFAWLISDWNDLSLLRRSCNDFGFALAQAFAGEGRFEERFVFAQRAAAQGERNGFYWLGVCFLTGEGCEVNVSNAKNHFLSAVECGGCVRSMLQLGFLETRHNDLARAWYWWGKAAAHGDHSHFFAFFSSRILRNEAAVFAIGRALKGHVDERARTIFQSSRDFDSHIDNAKRSIAFYDAQIKHFKDAVNAWTMIGIRFKVVKDVRKLIGMLIWEARHDAKYLKNKNI
jgi:hypothetical protein